MTENKMKTCKMCFKEISEQAKKCPYCLHWQNKLNLITFHPLFALTPIAIFFGICCLLLAGMFENLFHQGEPFSKYKSSIIIEKCKMKFGANIYDKETKHPTVAIMGKLKNNSDISWKGVVLEVQIFDKAGKLIDTKQKEKYSFVVPAHEEAAFKVSFEMEFPREEYNSVKVFIRSAKDERQRF